MTDLLHRIRQLTRRRLFARRRQPPHALIIRGWAATFHNGLGNIPKLVVVSATSRTEAVAKLEAAGFDITDPSQVHPTLTIPAEHEKYLRTDVTWREFDWESRPEASRRDPS